MGEEMLGWMDILNGQSERWELQSDGWMDDWIDVWVG